MKRNPIQIAALKKLIGWIPCSRTTLLIGLLLATSTSAQMLQPNRVQPDRNGWGDPEIADAQLNDWPYAQSPQSIPVDKVPDERIRSEIGLASFDQEVTQNIESRPPVAAPVRTANLNLPPRDAITDPFLHETPQPVELSNQNDFAASGVIGQSNDQINNKVVHSGHFAIAGEGSSVATVSAEAPVASSEAPSFDFSSLNNVFSGGDSALPRSGLGSSVQAMLLLAALSLAPAIVLMTTSYVRVVVVLSLLRQAFGSQQLPPTQVITALSLFLTMLVMAPVWNEVKTESIDPYAAESSELSWQEAWDAGVKPVRSFMQKQIQLAGNEQSIATFYRYLPETSQQMPSSFDDVPLNVLLPAFMVSELKVAFLLGFQVFLPFLVLDLVVSSVTVSMGMLMLPPNMVSFPLKLILFVMVDGWNLVIGMLLQSFGPFV